MGIPPIAEDTLVYASILALFSLGLTLTYMTTKVPNFAHATVGIVGSYTTLTITALTLLSVAERGVREGLTQPEVIGAVRGFTFSAGHYALFIFSGFAIGSLIGLAQYRGLMRPLSRRGASIVQLMIVTIAIDTLLVGLLNIYSDKLLEYIVKKTTELSSISGFRVSIGVLTRDFILYSYDYSSVLGTQRLIVVGPILAAATISLLTVLLMKTRFGIAMRASIGNPQLALALGIDVEKMYTIAWALSLGLAGMAGTLMPLKYMVNPGTGYLFILSIFAASILGGLGSLRGAVIGAAFIAIFEIAFFNTIASAFKISSAYRTVIPLIAMSLTLLFLPGGITSIRFKEITTKVKKLWSRRLSSF